MSAIPATQERGGTGMINFSCSSCSHELKISEKMAGRKGNCPYCGKPIQVPAAKPIEVPAAVWSEATIPPQPLPEAKPADLATVIPQGDTPGPEGGAEIDPQDYAFLSPARGPGELGWLGSYRVLKVLGVGGMGIVFLAEDPQLQRRIALKVMRADCWPATLRPGSDSCARPAPLRPSNTITSSRFIRWRKIAACPSWQCSFSKVNRWKPG